MGNYKGYYLPYVEKANVNYIYLLYLYSIAERYDTGRFDPLHPNQSIKSDISFKSWKDLENKINCKLSKYQEKNDIGMLKTLISSDTLKRNLLKDDYKYFLCIEKFNKEYTIILFNDFSNLGRLASEDKRLPFVRLPSIIIDLLLETKDNLLAKYIIYIKYYCGISNTNSTDFTAKQFLRAVGYKDTANNYISKISEYNRLLQERGIINIKKWRDDNGHERNTYTINC